MQKPNMLIIILIAYSLLYSPLGMGAKSAVTTRLVEGKVSALDCRASPWDSGAARPVTLDRARRCC